MEEKMMDRDVMQLSEKEVETFIADYPWLLNFDYEKVPQLKNKGMEYILSDSKRADLILRDRNSGQPIIVEFKAIPFYRENIGQILEYRARVINEYTSDDSILKEIFEDKLFAPKLVLVVPECTAEARLACNLSNIDIYEYYKTIPEIIVPENRKTLDEFIESYKNEDIPLSDSRPEWVDEIYAKIREVMEEENALYGWKNYNDNKSEYFVPLNHLFVNKCLFNKEEVMIGIYEDIFSDSNDIKIEYYSNEEQPLKDFVQKYKELNIEPNDDKIIDEESYTGYCWTFSINKKDFLKNTKEIIRPYIKNYIRVKAELEIGE
jgi:hypothetical protein